MTPNPHPFTIPTLLVIPRFSCFYCFSFFFLFSSFCLLRTCPPCPALLCCIYSLTASPPRLASPSITRVNVRPGNQLTRLPQAGITGMRSETHGFWHTEPVLLPRASHDVGLHLTASPWSWKLFRSFSSIIPCE